MKRCVTIGLVVAALLGKTAVAEESQFHEWVSTDGYKVMASLVGSEKDGKTTGVIFVLRKQDGKEIRVPAYRLSNESRKLAMKILLERETAITPDVAKTPKEVPEEAKESPKRTPAQTKAARDFSYGKVGLSTTLAQFKKLYPTAQTLVESADAKIGMTNYSIPAEDAFMVIFQFLDNQLYDITLCYRLEEAAKLGGHAMLLKRIKDKYGEPDGPAVEAEIGGKSTLTIAWTMKDAGRHIGFFVGPNDCLYISFRNEAVYDISQKKKAKLNPGF